MKKIMYAFLTLTLIFIINISPIMAETYTNYDKDGLTSCGEGKAIIENIPKLIPKVVSTAYTLIQIAVPVVLVIMGSLDLLKCISAKDSEINKGQQMFIKRLISAVFVFFVFVIVKIVISAVADNSNNSIMDCAQCFIEAKCNDKG